MLGVPVYLWDGTYVIQIAQVLFISEVTMEDEAGVGHRWEEGLEATWEAVREGEDGMLDIGDIIQAQRRRRRGLEL